MKIKAGDFMLTPKKQAALEALLTHETKKSAAHAAGISVRTMSTYLADDEFKREYTMACRQLVTDASQQSQKCLSPALSVLLTIANDKNEAAGNRIAACRSLLEYGLKLTEISDILAELEGDTDVL